MGRSDVAVADARPSQYYEFSAITIRKRSLALFFLRLPVFVPIIFMVPAWISLNALPVLATANTPSQRKLGKYWKKLQRMTYVIWFFAVVHLLDGIKPFGAADGDGIPVPAFWRMRPIPCFSESLSGARGTKWEWARQWIGQGLVNSS